MYPRVVDVMRMGNVPCMRTTGGLWHTGCTAVTFRRDDENGERDVPAGRLAAPPVEHDQITVLDGQPVCCVKERAD